ncbi:MAG: Endonuclease III [Desulfonauticus sp. 38_4375]|nr:MAG: Endonuclease III [Desulfonauticus sp. 38_4375]
MNSKELALTILKRLEKLYPLKTALNWQNPYELLVATILSAQCTDERVNKVTPLFFKKWPDAETLAQASLTEVEEVIRSTGFYRNKAKNLVNTAKILSSKHGGKVPSTMEELLELPGVARKTANIILSNCFGVNAGIAVDTHVKRLSFRLGLSREKSPDKIEKDLMAIFPRQEWGKVNHLLVYLGREICKARKPDCQKCPLADICPKLGIN